MVLIQTITDLDYLKYLGWLYILYYHANILALNITLVTNNLYCTYTK